MSTEESSAAATPSLADRITSPTSNPTTTNSEKDSSSLPSVPSDPTPAVASLSLADRITKPAADTNTNTTGEQSSEAQASSGTKSWADDVASPTAPKHESNEDGDKDEGIDQAQVDGAGTNLNGSRLQEPEEYDVEVKLSDIQGDPSNPLYSVKSFEEIGGL